MINLDTIDSAFHSVQIKDADGDVLAITAAGKINAIVEATDLDIRDLAFATDKVDVSGSAVSITGDVNVTQGTSPWVVSATNLDIRDLTSASDSVAAVQSGTWNVGVTGDVNVTQGTSPWVVSATDLDIRNLDYTQDNLVIKGATGNALVVNADGSVNVQSAEAGYSSWSVVAATVNTTESQLVASPLSGRLRVEIQNLGGEDVYVRQATGVSTSNGLKIPKGSSWEVALDAGASIYAITGNNSSGLRIAQYAA